MATKGYNSYRGRGNAKKIIISIVLILVILGAVGYLIGQNYIVYDDAGQMHLALPNREKEKKLPEDEINIEFVEPPEKWLPVSELHATQLTAEALKRDPASVLEGIDEALLIDVKQENGVITYATNAEVPAQIRVEKSAVTTENLKSLLDGGHYSIAHMYALHDGYYVQVCHDAAFLRNNGEFWYDGDGWTWLDPTNPDVLGYLTALCREYAALGFDEILLDDFSYPMNGSVDAIAMDEALDKTAVLQSVAESLRSVLPEDMVLSIVIRSEELEQIGLSAEMIAACFDRVYLAPGVDATALLQELPTEYDRNTRVVQMTKEKPKTGSYVLLE